MVLKKYHLLVCFAFIFAISASMVMGSMPVGSAPADTADVETEEADTPAEAGLGSWPLLKRGCRGADVKALQYLLKSRGYSISVDGVFGSGTQAVVKSFQRSKGLAADGVVGSRTWSKVIKTVRYGSRGHAVKAVQMQLKYKRHSSLSTDGVFGSITRSKVIDFQRAHGLSADGIVGPTTWRYLISHFTDLTRTGTSGRGWYHYGDDGIDDWGTANVIAQLQKIASYWYYNVRRSPRIGIGDISRSHGGYMPGHVSHRDGKDCDISVPRNDGREGGTQWNWGSYSRSLTRILLKRLWASGSVYRVLFNDPTLRAEGLCTYYSNHDNHLHVDWRY
jgi:peptidoglycan hydrolase-like protein with peptidoglycan-binding domain